MNKKTTDFFVCTNGDCKACNEYSTLFGCAKYGDCSECIAQFTSFCKGCKYNDDN